MLWTRKTKFLWLFSGTGLPLHGWRRRVMDIGVNIQAWWTQNTSLTMAICKVGTICRCFTISCKIFQRLLAAAEVTPSTSYNIFGFFPISYMYVISPFSTFVANVKTSRKLFSQHKTERSRSRCIYINSNVHVVIVPLFQIRFQTERPARSTYAALDSRLDSRIQSK